MSQQLVIFDFDGTLIRRDTTLWLVREFLISNPLKFPMVLCHLMGMLCARYRSSSRLQARKCKCIGFLIKGQSLPKLERSLDRFRIKALSNAVKPAFDRLKQADAAGMRVLVVTASADFAIKHVMKNYPVTVIGTSFVNRNGCYPGGLDGEPCFGSAKVKRADAWLSKNGYSWLDVVESWGDSPSDWSIMQKCEKRFWVYHEDVTVRKLRELDSTGNFVSASE